MEKFRTRFAPSPTGDIHVGGLRTALYAYALAKHSGGDFILRIEDTDKKREVAGGKEKIKEILQKFGIGWDEYYVQSERLELYRTAAKKLVDSGNAYEDEGAIRIKIPKDEKVSFHDFVLDKEITWDTNTLTDLVLLKSDGYPTYHLAVVVDDNDMGVTHVLRGHDWLPSTPLHLLIYKFLGYKVPEIGHLTDIMDPEGGKLSKRKGSTSCEGFLKEGYLPDAILNFVMLLGWAPKDNRELFTLGQFVEAFDPKGLQKSNPVLNRDKLDWFNSEYIRLTNPEFLKSIIYKFYDGKYPEDKIAKILPLIQTRVKTLTEFGAMAGFFFEKPKVDKKLFGPDYEEHLKKAIVAIEKGTQLDEVPKNNNFKVGDFFMDLRIAITGSKFTPPINESIDILGREESITRIRSCI